MLLCSCNACCCLYHQIKQTERKAPYFFTAISPCVWAYDDVQNMQSRAYESEAWWMGSNWEWQCTLPGARLFHSAPSLHSGALASVHRAEHLSSPQPLWWWPALPVRHTEFTSREMKQQGQSFLVTKLSLHEWALGWESRAHKFDHHPSSAQHRPLGDVFSPRRACFSRMLPTCWKARGGQG